MSVQPFALTSPSLTDMSDSINLAEARARYYDAERQGDAALAAWARAYAPPLLDFAAEGPKEHKAEIKELLEEAEEAFDGLNDLRKRLGEISGKPIAAPAEKAA